MKKKSKFCVSLKYCKDKSSHSELSSVLSMGNPRKNKEGKATADTSLLKNAAF